MKKVEYEYGCRSLGYVNGELYVDESMSDADIRAMIEDMANFGMWFNTEYGYEEQTEIVYRKVR